MEAAAERSAPSVLIEAENGEEPSEQLQQIDASFIGVHSLLCLLKAAPLHYASPPRNDGP